MKQSSCAISATRHTAGKQCITSNTLKLIGLKDSKNFVVASTGQGSMHLIQLTWCAGAGWPPCLLHQAEARTAARPAALAAAAQGLAQQGGWWQPAAAHL
jgi:hypothetical protein